MPSRQPLLLYFLSPFPHRRRCRAVELFESAVKKFLICKSISLHDVRNRILRVYQIMVYMRYPDFIQILEEGHPYIFFEKTAEGLLPKSSPVCDVPERDRLLVVLLHVGDDIPQAVDCEPVPLFVRGQHAGGKVPYEAGQHLQGQALRFQVKGGGVLDVEPGHIFKELADLQVGRKIFVAYQVRPAQDVMVFNVRHTVLEMLPGNVDAQEHGSLVIAEGTVHLHGLHCHKLLFWERVLCAFHGDVRQDVQRVQDLQLLVPVERPVAAGGCVESHVYP